MLDQTFLQLLNMSYTASFAILFILLARIALQKAPKRFSIYCGVLPCSA